MTRNVTNKGPVQSGTVLNLRLKQNAFRRFERQNKQKTNVARGIQRLGSIEIIRINFLETYGSELMERMKKSLELGYVIECSG
jgi:hypothetical protein